MNLRIGRVAAVHPEDHSVDLVMVDDGSRLVGVQVLAQGAGTSTGVFDLPDPDAPPDKWDLRQRTGREAMAVVGQLSQASWVVLGFLFPQVSQMTFADGRYFHRFPSDVYMTVTKAGDCELSHPNGDFIRLGASPAHEDLSGANFDANLSRGRNTGASLHLRAKIGTTTLTIAPGGHVTLEHAGNLTINTGGNAAVTAGGTATVTSGGAATVQAPSVTLDAPTVSCTGNLNVTGVTSTGGLVSSGTAGASSISGNLTITGTLTNNGVDVGSTHRHGGVQTGGGTTGTPS